MKRNNMLRYLFMGFLGLLVILASTAIIDCSSGGGGGGSQDDDNALTTYEISTGGFTNNIQLTAGQTTSHSFQGFTPGPKRVYDKVTLNLQAMLDSGYIVDRSLRTAQKISSSHANNLQPSDLNEWQVSFRIGAASEIDTICQDGWLYGPYTLRGNDMPETSDKEKISAEPSTVDLINFGSFAMCIQISSPIDLTLSINKYSVDVSTCDEKPADFAGTWTGTYSCDNQDCPDIPTSSIILHVYQDGHSASYHDEEAYYEGTVCGNVFSYNGGVEGVLGYIEKGTMTLNPDGTAHKQSSFSDNNGPCRGTCEDFLTRKVE